MKINDSIMLIQQQYMLFHYMLKMTVDVVKQMLLVTYTYIEHN